jgi:hypothetical protein
MIINHSHRFIYLHVPKTGGTSISTLLSGYSTPVDIELGGALDEFAGQSEKIWSSKWKLHKHSTHRRIRSIFPANIYHSYFKFAVVRNPYARTLSSFNFGKRNNAFNGLLSHMSFDEYIESDLFTNLKLQGSQSQADFLFPIEQLNYLGRLESIDKTAEFLSVSIGRDSSFDLASLQRLNQTTPSDSWREMDSGTMKRIADVLPQDFESLGYSKLDGSIIPGFKFSFHS